MNLILLYFLLFLAKYTRQNDKSVQFCEKCNFFIGGLFPVHAPKSRDNNKYNYYAKLDQQINNKPTVSIQTKETTFDIDSILAEVDSCGEIKKERGIQRLEAMLYAIDLINNSSTILPDIKLGAKIYDTCDRDTIALDKCVNFIGDHFILNKENYENDFTCKSNVSTYGFVPVKNKEEIYKRKVVGVIGAASSSVSVQVANILRLFQIPQISYASTSPDLSDRDRFPYFSRVLPSDTLQAEAMSKLVKSLNWNYVATINEEGNVGGIDAFIANAKNESSYTLSQTASEQDVSRIVTEMYKNNAKAVVLFLQDHNIKKLLSTVKNLNLSEHFLFVASDSWGTKKESIHSFDSVAEGTITFAPKSFHIRGFNEYFKRLKPKKNTRNPWFTEFWEGQFNCTMNKSVAKSKQLQLCSGEEQLQYAQDGFIHFVIDSVFAMAHALHSIKNKYCKTIKADELYKCEQFSPIKGPELLREIRNVEFNSISGRRVKFLKEKTNLGDGIVPFEVFQYQYDEQNKYHYEKIAEWDSDIEYTRRIKIVAQKYNSYFLSKFTIESAKLKWRGGSNSLPKAVCKEECEQGEIKQGDTCCWVCVKCDETEYSTINKSKCVKCPLGDGPNINKTGCIKLPVEYMFISSAFSYVPIIISSLGILVTCYCIAIFIRFSETPIIKASGRELCYVLLAGILSCYLMTFPLVLKPTAFSCFILRIGVSLSLTLCLSALFTKTNRLSRIFNSSVKKLRQTSYVSPKSQLVICFSIIGVEVIGLIVWVLLAPPGLKFDYDDPKRVVLQCKTQYTSLAITLFYNLILVVLCTTYAIKTRKIPENFNEARFIGLTMYSICVIWLAFIAIYFGSSAASGRSYRNNYRIQLTTIAMCLNFSASVILGCLFMPKLKVVLFKPNKNVRKSGNMLKVTSPRNLNGIKDMIDHQNQRRVSQMKPNRLGKFSFLWPVVAESGRNNSSQIKTDDKKTTEEIFNEKSALNSEFKEKSNSVGNDFNATKKLSIKNKNSKTSETANTNLEISSKNANSNINAELISSDIIIKNELILSDIEDKEISNELLISKNIEEEKLIRPADDDDFFNVNKEVRDNYLRIKNKIEETKEEDMKDFNIEKVNELEVVDEEEEEEEEEENNISKSIIILNCENPVVTTLSFFNNEPSIFNENKDPDQFESMRITYV